MGILAVILAAAASWGFGAAWYMKLGPRWMAAAGLTEADMQKKDPTPFIVSFLCAIVVAGMMRHIFAMGGIDGAVMGLVTGLGLGLFIAVPWIATNYLFAQRDKALIWIDGGYAAIGSSLMGLVLGLF